MSLVTREDNILEFSAAVFFLGLLVLCILTYIYVRLYRVIQSLIVKHSHSS
jgi:hypothetical protein